MDVLENTQNQAIEDIQKASKWIEIQNLDDMDAVELGCSVALKGPYKKTENETDEDGNEVEVEVEDEVDEVDALYKSIKTETVQTKKLKYENGKEATEEVKETEHTQECCTDNSLKYFLLALLIVMIGVIIIVVVVVVMTQQKKSEPRTEQGRNML